MSSRLNTGLPLLLALAGLALGLCGQQVASKQVAIKKKIYNLYPQTLDLEPGLSSPLKADDGSELVIACTKDQKYGLVPVTVADWTLQEVKYFESYILTVDKEDFPVLAQTGLHSESELEKIKSINGRPIAEITELSKPSRLSDSGFLAENEDILTVIKEDNRLVAKLGLTHPQMARALIHLWNVILQEQNCRSGVWMGGPHTWVHFDHFLYNGKKIFYQASFTKGGQKSPFQDGIEGAAHTLLRRELDSKEEAFLAERYARLSAEKLNLLKKTLSEMTIGEMHPFFIGRYGFYEGHTFWRADPLAIAFIFGLRSLAEIESAFPNRLDELLTAGSAQEK